MNNSHDENDIIPLIKECTAPYNYDSPNSANMFCMKSNYLLDTGEYIEHAGGHFFVTQQGKEHCEKVANGLIHEDAGALLAGLPAEWHYVEDCNGQRYCAWR